ncbi:MAG: DoxX family protein [Bacteroidetes bacterium]|nr:DoxX family protein [Bacteroidota bacterium]
MFNKLIETDSKDYISLIVRVVLGLVMLPHGAQKLFGWFGGYGYTGTMGYFTDTVGIPYIIGFLVILGETLGALLLIFGLTGRISGLSIIANMLGAAIMVHLPNGFFMNWFGNLKGEGYEYQILAITLALIIVIKGSGMFSLDAFLQTKNPYNTQLKAA